MKFPKTLYVSIDNSGSGHKDDDFLSAQDSPAFHAVTGEVTPVARYELVEVGTVTAEPIFVPASKKRR